MYFLNFFDACGFDSGASKLSSNRITCFIYLMHILAAALFTAFSKTFIYMYASYPLFNPVEAVNSFVQYFAPLFTYWLMIFEAYFQRRAHKHFWKILQQTEYVDSRSDCVPLWFKCKFFEFFVVPTLFILIQLNVSEYAVFLTMAYVALAKICQVRVFYYIYCLEIVNIQLQHLEHHIETLRNISTQAHSGSFERNNIRKSSASSIAFRRFREKYSNIFEMTCLLNEIFGWSQVSAVLFCFYFLLGDLNYVYPYFQFWTLAEAASE